MISDNILTQTYAQTGSVWKTGNIVGLSGQQVYDRLNKLGVVKHLNYWTKADDDVLKEKYITYKMANELDMLAKELGRTKPFICRKAKELGLTDNNNKKLSKKAREKISNNTKRYIKEKGHPRGFLGHKHSDETKVKLSCASKKCWANPNSIVNSEPFRQRMSDNLHNMKMKGQIKNFSIHGDHKIKINGKDYTFKSTWEVEIAKRLQSLLDNGYIYSWDYESKHFNFQDMKRGIRSYCPDFEVVLADQTCLYIEVKGWKMPTSMKRIEMFRERYPHVKFYLIDDKEYGKILSQSDYLRRRCV